VQADEDADGAVVGIAREKNGMVVSRDSDLMLMDSCGYIDMPQFFEYGLQREDPRGPKLLTPVFHPGTPLLRSQVSMYAYLCAITLLSLSPSKMDVSAVATAAAILMSSVCKLVNMDVGQKHC